MPHPAEDVKKIPEIYIHDLFSLTDFIKTCVELVWRSAKEFWRIVGEDAGDDPDYFMAEQNIEYT